jgi:uncharacterized membrane protein YdjX (TVP38/TMEM64 family)
LLEHYLRLVAPPIHSREDCSPQAFIAKGDPGCPESLNPGSSGNDVRMSKAGDSVLLAHPCELHSGGAVQGYEFRRNSFTWSQRKVTRINGKRRNHIWIKLLGLLLVVCGISALIYQSDWVRLFLCKDKLMHFLESLGPWASVVFVFLQAFQVVAAPIPGEATGLLGGFIFGPWLGILLSTIGLTLGSYIAFALARGLGRPFVERFAAPTSLERFDYLLHHKGAFLVFLLFLIPGFPKDALCYVLGLGHLSTMEFLLIGGVGRLLGTVLLTLEGNYLRLQQYGRFYILLGIALVIVLFAMGYKEKFERMFRYWHNKDYRKKKAKPVPNTE